MSLIIVHNAGIYEGLTLAYNAVETTFSCACLREFCYDLAMNLSWKHFLAGTASSLLLLSGSVSPAMASVSDWPFFNATALVVVIGATEDEANGGVAPVAVDFAILTPASSGSAAPDLIGSDGFVFNSNSGFDPGHDFSGGATRFDVIGETSGATFGNPGGGDIDFLEASDTLTSFGIDNDTNITDRPSRNVSRFLVVSNAPFDVFSEARDLTTTGDFTR